MGIAELMEDLAQAPQFSGARCRDEWQVFDRAATRSSPGGLRAARAQALEICAGCPALQDCRHWLDHLPPEQRPRGVCGGVIIASR